MAIVNKTYDFLGPTNTTLSEQVQDSSSAIARCTSGARLIISFDDAIDGAEASADETMESFGFYPASTVETQIMMQSPDGSYWALTVSNAGVLSVAAVP